MKLHLDFHAEFEKFKSICLNILINVEPSPLYEMTSAGHQTFRKDCIMAGVPSLYLGWFSITDTFLSSITASFPGFCFLLYCGHHYFVDGNDHEYGYKCAH